MTKSPFYIIQDFLSKEEALKLANNSRIPLTEDDNGVKQKSERFDLELEKPLFQKLMTYKEKIESYYDLKIRGVEHLLFQQFPLSQSPLEEPQCGNSVFKRKKWIKIRDRDLCGMLWLKDYNETPPFNQETEVYGAKHEFKMFNFGFQPQVGTLVLYPADPHFIYATSSLLVGELQSVRINIAAEGIWLYDHTKFPGDYTSWFNNFV